MTTGRKLALTSALVGCAIIYLAYLGAAESWRYYLTVDECLADVSLRGGSRLRVRGKVAPGSLQIAGDRRHADFVLQGLKGSFAVSCTGSIPNNLAESMEIIVEGRLDDQSKFRADKLLTRCASKYQSQNPAAASIPAPLPEDAQ